MAKARDRYRSQSLERGISILDCLGDSEEPLALKDLCARTGLDTGTAYRYLAVLSRHRYVHKDPVTRRYSLSYGLFRLGHRPFALATLAQQAQSFLRDLAGLTGLSAAIGALEGREVVTLSAVADGKSLAHEALPVADAHTSAMGKALLAHFDTSHFERLYREVPLRRITDRTVTSISALNAELRSTREHGYATEAGETRPNRWAVASAVVNPRGQANVAFELSGPASRFAGARASRLGRQAKETAQRFTEFIIDAA